VTPSSDSLFVAISRAVEQARDRLDEGLNQAGAWIERVRTGGMNGRLCAVCRRAYGPFERHHIAGRRNSDLTVSVCLRCHRRLSGRQKEWDPRWQATGNSRDLKESLLIRGLSDLCKERARYSSPAYRELGRRLRATYFRRARETVP
jgi:hypothetical protein